MAGYANRTITLDFPDLSEEGDRIYVVIRNPKTLPLKDLQSANVKVDVDETGRPLDGGQAMAATYDLVASLIVGANVYDSNDYSDTLAPLPVPMSADQVATLPFAIIQAVGEEIEKVTSTPR